MLTHLGQAAALHIPAAPPLLLLEGLLLLRRLRRAARQRCTCTVAGDKG